MKCIVEINKYKIYYLGSISKKHINKRLKKILKIHKKTYSKQTKS